jgi:predicted MFS family arabinose efflux permease
MKYQRGKKTGWRITLAVVAMMTMLACGLLIALDVRKVAREEKVERKFMKKETIAKPASTFPPLERQPDD